MGLLNGAGSIGNALRNPFSSSTVVDFDGPDFPDGFLIEEILDNGKVGESIRLYGNQMPKIPFSFGGKQRVKKEYYSGFSEPSTHVMGAEENDITIKGTLKDKKYPLPQYKNVSTDIQQLITGIRLRGNLVRIAMGEFERYAILLEDTYELRRLSNLDYAITFSIIGFNAPKNAHFLEQTREVPFAINKDLIAGAQDFQKNNLGYPTSVPLSIAGAIGALTNLVAGAIASVTGFVDGIIGAVNDIAKAINRVKGLIKFTQSKLKELKNFVGALKPFDANSLLTGKYAAAKYYSSVIRLAASLTAILEKLKKQIGNLGNTIPLGRHFTVSGDTLQKISVKFYGFADNWKKIYDYNNLSSTELVAGKLLEIPRV